MNDGPIQTLMREHRIIEKVVFAMPRLADALEHGDAVDIATLEGLVPFMREFADGCHHAKEEHLLFPVLVARGLPPSGGPVQVMCAEHETARAIIRRLEQAVADFNADPAQTKALLADLLREIAALYTVHIQKEEGALFPMAENLLPAEDAAELAAEFAKVDAQHRAAVDGRFVPFAERLAGEPLRNH